MNTRHRPHETEPPFDPFADNTATVTAPRGGPASGGRRKPHPGPARPVDANMWGGEPTSADGVDDEETPDYSSLETVNSDLLRLRVRMNRIRREMARSGREAASAKLAYQRAMRRSLIEQSGGTAEIRRAHAEIACEELETVWIVAQQVADEYVSLFRATRDDAENAKTVAFNLRSILNTSH